MHFIHHHIFQKIMAKLNQEVYFKSEPASQCGSVRGIFTQYYNYGHFSPSDQM